MDWIAGNAGNIAALLLVFAIIGAALRSVIRGSARDCSSCSGDCGGSCESPRLKLSKEQLARLAELDEEYGV